MVEIYKIIALYFWYKILSKFKSKTSVISRIFEGISIGVYANVIGELIESGINLDLIYKAIVAIILTISSIYLEKEK